MNEPELRLGATRAAPRQRLTLWESVRGWWRKAPAQSRLAALPKPPRAVLLRRTLAEDTRSEAEHGPAR